MGQKLCFQKKKIDENKNKGNIEIFYKNQMKIQKLNGGNLYG